MRKRKYLVSSLVLLSLAILGFTAHGYHVGLANSVSSASTQNISTIGTISYPAYNATPNLALIPDDWSLTYGDGPQIIHLDYNVTHNGNVSIRLDPHTSNDVNTASECDGTWYSVKPGDHIVAKVWIKTSSGTPQEAADPLSGARLGMDLYGVDSNYPGDICIVDNKPNTYDEHVATMVRFGTSNWTLRTWDIIVPATYYTQDLGTGNTINPVQICSFVLWLQLCQWPGSTPATTQAWFADAELYINP